MDLDIYDICVIVYIVGDDDARSVAVRRLISTTNVCERTLPRRPLSEMAQSSPVRAYLHVVRIIYSESDNVFI